MERLKNWLFNVYLAFNMLFCAVLAFGVSRPRETISGCLGRTKKLATERGKRRPIIAFFNALVDRLYFWEPNHCRVTAEMEAKAREALGYKPE